MAISSALTEGQLVVKATEIFFVVCDTIEICPEISRSFISRAGVSPQDLQRLPERWGLLFRRARQAHEKPPTADKRWDLRLYTGGKQEPVVYVQRDVNDYDRPDTSLERLLAAMENCVLLVEQTTFTQLRELCDRHAVRYRHHYQPGCLATAGP